MTDDDPTPTGDTAPTPTETADSADVASLQAQLDRTRRRLRLLRNGAVGAVGAVVLGAVVLLALDRDGDRGAATSTTTTVADDPAHIVAGFACGNVRHEPPLTSPDSLSTIELSLFVVNAAGQLPAGAELVVTVQGADGLAVGPVERTGLVTVRVPISAYGDYPVAAATITSPIEPALDVTDVVQHAVGMMSVTTAEGPLAGCTDPRLLSEEDQQDRASLLAEDATAPFRTFLVDWADAHARRDVDALLASLDPVVIGIHGTDACRRHLTDVAGDVLAIDVVDAIPAEYRYEAGGEEALVTDAWALRVDFLPVGAPGTVRTDMHLRHRDDGTVTWFTDCGGVGGASG